MAPQFPSLQPFDLPYLPGPGLHLLKSAAFSRCTWIPDVQPADDHSAATTVERYETISAAGAPRSGHDAFLKI
jgi:hypothetical protein